MKPNVVTKELLLRKMTEDSMTGCWNWTGWKWNGYGKIRKKYKPMSVHRVAYELWIGPIKDNLCVCHHCDNPSCFNPSHLFLGTVQENIADKDRKGHTPKGENHYMAKLTAEQALIIRSSNKSQRALGREFCVDHSTIRAIKHGRTWKQI